MCLKSLNYFIYLCGPKACPKYKPMLLAVLTVLAVLSVLAALAVLAVLDVYVNHGS